MFYKKKKKRTKVPGRSDKGPPCRNVGKGYPFHSSHMAEIKTKGGEDNYKNERKKRGVNNFWENNSKPRKHPSA